MTASQIEINLVAPGEAVASAVPAFRVAVGYPGVTSFHPKSAPRKVLGLSRAYSIRQLGA